MSKVWTTRAVAQGMPIEQQRRQRQRARSLACPWKKPEKIEETYVDVMNHRPEDAEIYEQNGEPGRHGVQRMYKVVDQIFKKIRQGLNVLKMSSRTRMRHVTTRIICIVSWQVNTHLPMMYIT